MNKIAITAFSFGEGGTEKMLVHLARGLTEWGCRVDFLLQNSSGAYLDAIRTKVRMLEVEGASQRERLAAIGTYLLKERPHVLLSGKRSDEEAVRAAASAGVSTRVFLRIGTTVSRRNRSRSFLKSFLNTWKLKKLIPAADGVIAVSQGVAQDIRQIVGNTHVPIHVVPNPVIGPELENLAAMVPQHPFFLGEQKLPVVIGIGGLRKAKDFPTLIRAFHRVLRQRPARLIILGRGRQKDELLRLVRELDIQPFVSFPGFTENPYAYLAHSQVFALSSLWEGSPNVVTEALAVGTPVVSTDCPSGPREILQDGKYGRLVPCGDPQAMAAAILETLANPPPKTFLKQAVRDYTIAASSEKYLHAFGLQKRG